jgi:predicted ATP-grasp superfamily ATP-dependent carboligase
VAEPGYAEAVRAGAEAAKARVVLAASDAALLALGADVGRFVDKAALMGAAADAAIVVPPTTRFDTVAELVDAARRGTVSYPSVVKPVVSRAPAARVDATADVEALAPSLGAVVVQPFLTGQLWAVSGVIVEGRVLAAVQQRYLRTWPVDCGTASAAVTVDVDEDVVTRLGRLLAGYDGIFQAQFAGPALLDVNPRVYGSLSLAAAAGVNLPDLWVRWVLDGTAPSRSLRGRVGVHYRWLEGDVRHVLARLRGDGRAAAGVVASAARPWPGSAHSVEALTDPRPLLTRVVAALRGST